MSLFSQCCIFGLVFALVVAGIIVVIALVSDNSTKKGKDDLKGLVGLGVIGVVVCLVAWAISTGGGKPPGGIYKFDEYDAAKRFIQSQYPGAQKFSSCDDSTVQADPADGTCRVVIDVSGVNSFNAPIRDTMTVIMQFQNGSFGLTRIESQNEFNLVKQQIKDGN